MTPSSMILTAPVLKSGSSGYCFPIRLRSARADSVSGPWRRHGGKNTHAEVAIAPRVGVDLEVARRASGVLHAGDAIALRFADRGAERGRAFRPSHLRHVVSNERHRRLLEDARWLAGPRILDDRPADWILRLSRNLGELERVRVDPRRMAVVADDLRRAIGDDRVELLPGRQAAAKRLRIPSTPKHPRRVGVCGRPGPDPRLHFVERVRAVQIDAIEAEPTGDEIEVCIVETGNDRRALGIDHRSLRTAEPHDLALASDAQNLVAADGDGFRHRAVRTCGIHLRVVDDHVDRTVGVAALRADNQSGDERRSDDSHNDIGGQSGGHTGRILTRRDSVRFWVRGSGFGSRFRQVRGSCSVGFKCRPYPRTEPEPNLNLEPRTLNI